MTLTEDHKSTLMGDNIQGQYCIAMGFYGSFKENFVQGNAIMLWEHIKEVWRTLQKGFGVVALNSVLAQHKRGLVTTKDIQKSTNNETTSQQRDTK